MQITQKLFDKNTAKPKASLVLENIGSIPTFQHIHEVRHPLASYNISLSYVAKRILTTLEILENTKTQRGFDSPKKPEWDLALLEATDHMLDALMEHIDDCSGIIRSFYPSSKDNDFKRVHKEFKKHVAPYRNHIGSIVNYIKHNQGRLRSIPFSWPKGASLGYFVEGPVSNNGLGPVSVIHPTENTAFSYNRDIPFHLCNLYAVSSNLAAVLYSVNKELIPAKGSTSTTEKQSELSQALSMAACLPMNFFEDELDKGVPTITDGSKSFTIEYPNKKAKPLCPPDGAKISVSFYGDGVTHSYKMPYFNNES